jgi:hypothetical protein
MLAESENSSLYSQRERIARYALKRERIAHYTRREIEYCSLYSQRQSIARYAFKERELLAMFPKKVYLAILAEREYCSLCLQRGREHSSLRSRINECSLRSQEKLPSLCEEMNARFARYARQ